MKPVFQEIVDKDKGDCMSACLASLLEIPLDRVPKFAALYGVKNLMKEARRWLAEQYGLSIVTIQLARELKTGEDIRIIGAAPLTPCIAGGQSATFEDCQHAVVGELDETGMNFRMTHDPNPASKGLVGQPFHLYFLVPLDPTIVMKTIEAIEGVVEANLRALFSDE